MKDKAWASFTAEKGMLVVNMTMKEIFQLGYLAAWYDREGEWEDGYKRGWGDGRHEAIKEEVNE